MTAEHLNPAGHDASSYCREGTRPGAGIKTSDSEVGFLYFRRLYASVAGALVRWSALHCPVIGDGLLDGVAVEGAELARERSFEADGGQVIRLGHGHGESRGMRSPAAVHGVRVPRRSGIKGSFLARRRPR